MPGLSYVNMGIHANFVFRYMLRTHVKLLVLKYFRKKILRIVLFFSNTLSFSILINDLRSIERSW